MTIIENMGHSMKLVTGESV